MQEKTLLSKQEKIAKLKEYLNKTRVDEGVVKDTLNVNTDRINPHMLLAASTKVLKVNREEVEPDDRDNLKYSDFLGLEDFIHEHVHKDAGKLQRKAKMKMDQKKNLDWLHAGFFTPQVRSIIVGNSLSQNVEGNNPLELYSTSHRCTKLGEGGLQCYDELTEVLTATGFKYWRDVTSDDKLATRDANGCFTYEKPKKLFKDHYEGLMYGITSERLNLLVTPNHKHWIANDRFNRHTKVNSMSPFHFEDAELGYNKKRHFELTANPQENVIADKPITIGDREFDPVLFAELLGYYLADGYFRFDPNWREYRWFITKYVDKNPSEYEAIKNVLTKLDIKFREDFDHHQFVMCGKEMAEYFSQFGKSWNKFIPDWVIHGNSAVRKALYTALTTHDCSGDSEFSREYQSTSIRLRDGIVMLSLSLGYGVTCYIRNQEQNHECYTAVIRYAKRAVANKGMYYKTLYNGFIYCAEVSSHFLLVRREGRCNWSGNSTQSIPEESRSVSPSSFGLFDALQNVESTAIGVTNYLARNVIKGNDRKLYKLLKNNKTGKIEWVSHDKMLNSKVRIPDA